MKGLMEIQLAYIAGLFDGEGTIFIGKYVIKSQKSLAYRGYMSIANTHVPTLEYVKSLLGGKIVYQGVGDRCYSLYFSPNQIRNWLPQFLPYLKIKRDQAEVLLAFLEKQANKAFAPVSLELLQFSESCYQKMKQLKKKRFFFKEKVVSLGIRKCPVCDVE